MHRNQSVSVHQFAMVPRADIPRSSFQRQFTHKTTLNAGALIPLFCDEVLPGDTFNLRATIFARMATPIFPIMDNLYLDTFYFFVPNRLVWNNWVKFMGEQTNPGDSISYVIPQIVSPAGGFVVNGIYDYFGLPTAGQIAGSNTISINALPLRGYNLIWSEWFRDENLQNFQTVNKTDGPDVYTNYVVQRRGKRHDYFTSCLPFLQKGTAVSLPLGTSAPVIGISAAASPQFREANQGNPVMKLVTTAGSPNAAYDTNGLVNLENLVWDIGSSTATGLKADLSAATAATINQLRQSFQIQKLLERDARGGTRYQELVRSHFGVIGSDARLQRPEFLGGGSAPIGVSEIAQTSGTGAQGTTAPVGTLSARATVVSHGSGFSQSFTEHGYVFGLCSIRADLTYQQGLRKLWSRSTRYDFYFPAFAMLGEQAVLNQEIYCDGSANDVAVFGYNERWAEYRYLPSMITGQFRSTYSTPLDGWHLAQDFSTLPVLDAAFIADHPPISRVVAAGSASNGAEFLVDAFFNIKTARCMPLYSVPGLIDHF